MQVIILNYQNGQGIFAINIDTSKIDTTKFTQWRALIIAEVKRRFNVDLTDEDISQIKFRPTYDISQPGVVYTNDANPIPVQPASAFITIRLTLPKTELLLEKKCAEITHSFRHIFDLLINQEEALDPYNLATFEGYMRLVPGSSRQCQIRAKSTIVMLRLIEEGLEQHYKETIDCTYEFNTDTSTGDPNRSVTDLILSSTKNNFFSFDTEILLDYVRNRIVNILALIPIKKLQVRAEQQKTALNHLIDAIENNTELALSIIRDGEAPLDGILGPYGHRDLVPLRAATSHTWRKPRITRDSERAEITRQLILKGANIAVTFPSTSIQPNTLLDQDKLFPLTEPGNVLVEAVHLQTESIVSDHPEIVNPQN